MIKESAGCTYDVSELDAKKVRKCGRPIDLVVDGRELCYICGLNYALAAYRNDDRKCLITAVKEKRSVSSLPIRAKPTPKKR